jgi:hypothetical protein
MSEMVELVAASLREANPGLVNPEAWPWLTLARAAIAAMRVPTEAMKAAAHDNVQGEHYDLAWFHMIDEALK